MTAKKETLNKNKCFLTEEVLMKPLYRNFSIKGYKHTDIFQMNNFELDLFCQKCMQRQIYHFEHISEIFNWFYLIGKADCNHNLMVMFECVDNNEIRKVGQSPSPEVLNEQFSKPSIDKFVEKFMQPMWEHDIEILHNDDIKFIKKEFRKEYEKINDQKNSNKLTVKQVLEVKEKVEMLEAKAIVDVYNKMYNLPFGKPIEEYEYKVAVRDKEPTKKNEKPTEWELSPQIFSLFW